jgi:dipeptidyl aminopeptidase/acylaminoacyl peptidase
MGTQTGRVIATLAAVACLSTRAEAAPPSIADFAADTDFSFPTLSPSGDKIAYVTRMKDSRVLVVLDLAKRERKGIMQASNESFELTWCGFKTEDRLLCGFSGTDFSGGDPYPVSRLVAIDASGDTKAKVLVQNGSHGDSQFQDRIMDWQIDDPKHVFIQLMDEDSSGPFPNVYALDVFNGLTTIVQRSRAPIMHWSTDRKGVVRFGSGYDDRKSTYITRDNADGSWRTLAKWERGDVDFDVVGFGPSPATLLVSAAHNGRSAIYEMDLAEKSDRQLLFANEEVDVGEPLLWPTDKRIIGFTYDTDRGKRMLFDDEAASIYNSIDDIIPNAENFVVDSSRDGKKLLIASAADVRPTDYYILDLNDRKMRKVGSANPALSATPLAPMKAIKIKAPDGTMRPG